MRLSPVDHIPFLTHLSFLNLIQHRFASHCCETLFRQSAPVVTQETVSQLEVIHKDKDAGKTYVSMENLFLYTVNEIRGSLGYLMTDKYASYALRLLLIVLSGRPLEKDSIRSTMPSKRKGRIEFSGQAKEESERCSSLHRVPESFGNALENITSEISAGLDSHYFRILATHPVANPVLQLLFELELSNTKQSKARDDNSLFRKLLPDHTLRHDTVSAIFLRGLIFDPIGSRLMETIIQFAPARDFKAIFHILFQIKLRSLITNDTASFVVIKILQRLSSKDLKEATLELCPAISMPMNHARTMVVKTLIERCVIRNVDTTPIAAALGAGDGNSKKDTFLQVLNWRQIGIETTAPEGKPALGTQNASGLHGSLLAQSMLDVPGALRDIVVEGILSVETSVLLQMAQDRTATHIVQKAITCIKQAKPFHRRIIHKLLPHTINLALDPIGSYVLHAVWTISGDLIFLKERIADQLLKNEASLRESPSGRRVWRIWMMDLCKRRKTDWITKAREIDVDRNAVQLNTSSDIQDHMKTRIDLAREQYNMARTGTAFTE